MLEGTRYKKIFALPSAIAERDEFLFNSDDLNFVPGQGRLVQVPQVEECYLCKD
jgi:hypothetical protein